MKDEYEQAIANLEEAIVDFQKKNWNLHEENQDLNRQLDDMQELLREIKAMNSLEPLKGEYRKMAELEMLAQSRIEHDIRRSNDEQIEGSSDIIDQ